MEGAYVREKREKWTRLITEWHPLYGKRNRVRQNKRWKNNIRTNNGSNIESYSKRQDRMEIFGGGKHLVGRQAESD